MVSRGGRLLGAGSASPQIIITSAVGKGEDTFRMVRRRDPSTREGKTRRTPRASIAYSHRGQTRPTRFKPTRSESARRKENAVPEESSAMSVIMLKEREFNRLALSHEHTTRGTSSRAGQKKGRLKRRLEKPPSVEAPREACLLTPGLQSV